MNESPDNKYHDKTTENGIELEVLWEEREGLYTLFALGRRFLISVDKEDAEKVFDNAQRISADISYLLVKNPENPKGPRKLEPNTELFCSQMHQTINRIVNSAIG